MAKDVLRCVASRENLNHYFDKHVSLSQGDKGESTSISKEHINKLLELINEKDSRFSKDPLSVGSASQGLKVGTANEFDVNVRLCNYPKTSWSYDIRPKCDLKRLHSPAKTESEDEGYISIMNPPQEWYDLSRDNTLSPQSVRQRFKRLLKEVVEENRELSEAIEIDRLYHGPAITIQISVQGLDHPIDVDFSPMIESEAGFPCWVQWPHPDTAWPSNEKKEEVRKSGINLVPKGDEMWLISYSKAERELRKGIDNDTCRIKCHRIMKKLREDVWCKAPASKKTLTSYHLKNLLFHECEKYPDDDSWSNDKLAVRFHGMLINLIECLRGGKLDMYMDRKINLLKGKEGEALDKVLTNIIRFWNNPTKYLQPEEH